MFSSGLSEEEAWLIIIASASLTLTVALKINLKSRNHSPHFSVLVSEVAGWLLDALDRIPSDNRPPGTSAVAQGFLMRFLENCWFSALEREGP